MKMKINLVDNNEKSEPEVITVNLKDLGITKKDLEEYKKLFCKCNYLKENPNIPVEYVENYLGVNHGYICPKCKKFVQIG